MSITERLWWQWAADTSNEEFLTEFRRDGKNLISILSSCCEKDSDKKLKPLVDPILKKIALIDAKEFIVVTSFFKKLITWEGHSRYHVSALLGIYLRAIDKGSIQFAKITSQLMHSDLANRADMKFLSDICLRSEQEKRFLLLCQEDKIEEIQKMIEEGIDVNTTDPLGFTPLHIACLGGQLELVKVLLSSKQLEIDKTNLKGDTALLIAAFKAQRDICALLIQRNASLEAVNSGGCTPFLSGCMTGNLSVIELLLENGASIEVKCCNGLNGADVALDWDHDALLDFLQKKGLFPCDLANILRKAIEKNDFDKIDLLLKEDLKHIKNPANSNFLNWAFENGHLSLFKALFNKEQLTISTAQLLYNAIFCGSDDLAVFLKEEGITLDDVDNKQNGATLLHRMSARGELEHVKKLLEFGATIDSRNHGNWTPLILAIMSNQLEVATYLVDQGADFAGIYTNNGTSALELALNGNLTGLVTQMLGKIG